MTIGSCTPQIYPACGFLSTIESSTTESVGNYSSIAVDNNDNIHLAYSSTTNGPIKYATNAPGSWATSSIAAATGNEVSLALDSAGKAHIAYRSTTPGLGYANNVSGVWSVNPVDSLGGTSPSIAVDSENHAHISHVYFSGSPTQGRSNTRITIRVLGPSPPSIIRGMPGTQLLGQIQETEPT